MVSPRPITQALMCNRRDQAGLGLPILMSSLVVLALHRVMDDTVDQF
jgi:hypothetical protein